MKIELEFTDAQVAAIEAARVHSDTGAKSVQEYVQAVMSGAAASYAAQWSIETAEGLRNRLAAAEDAKARALSELAQVRESAERLKAETAPVEAVA